MRFCAIALLLLTGQRCVDITRYGATARVCLLDAICLIANFTRSHWSGAAASSRLFLITRMAIIWTTARRTSVIFVPTAIPSSTPAGVGTAGEYWKLEKARMCSCRAANATTT